MELELDLGSVEQELISRSNLEGSSDPVTDFPQIVSSNLLSYQKAATTPFKDQFPSKSSSHSEISDSEGFSLLMQPSKNLTNLQDKSKMSVYLWKKGDQVVIR